jgi:PAS domain S-box-containing protein
MSGISSFGVGAERTAENLIEVRGWDGSSEPTLAQRVPLLRRWYLGYALAVVTTLVATLGRAALGTFGHQPPYTTYFPMIMLVALASGQGPGITTTVLSALCADYFFVLPAGSLMVGSTSEAIALFIFLIGGCGVSWMAGALNKREEELKAAFETSPAAMAVIDNKFVFKRVNRALARLHGRKVEDYRGKTIWQVVPRLAPTFEPIITKVMQTGRPIVGVALRANDPSEPGVTRHWEASYFPIRHSGNRVVEVGAVIFENTKTKQLEESLLQSEAHLKDAQRLAKIGSWRWEITADVMTWSDELFRIVGMEPCSRAPSFAEQEKMFRAEGWMRLNAVVERAIKTGEIYEEELEIIRPDGTTRWVIERGQKEQDADSGTTVLHGTVQDVTERKRSDETRAALAENERLLTALRRTVNDKQAMLQEVHHRVKNNLQIISSLLGMQASSVKDAQAVAQLVDSERRVKSMAMIHEHLYRHDDVSSVDLADYVRDLVAELFDSYSRGRHVDYRLEILPTRVAIQQAIPCGLILNELITNALKYAYPEGEGEVLIRLGTEGDHILMSVTDFGVGMPVGFDRNNCKSFGLTIVEALTQQLDGVMEMSGPPGASFTVRFADLSKSLDGPDLAEAARA